MLNKSGLKIDLCGTPDTISSQSLRTTQILFSVGGYEGNYAPASRRTLIVHKHSAW